MKRGFKAEAERIASELRGELGLNYDDCLQPLKLAEHLAIPVFVLAEVARVANSNGFVKYFSTIDPDSFSAITIVAGLRRIIVHNESHHPNRQASNITHEISHIVLEHEPTLIVSPDGQRYWNSEMEEEANWLGAALLVPREGALAFAKRNWAVCKIAQHYGVSEALCSWRISQTGIAYQLQRLARR